MPNPAEYKYIRAWGDYLGSRAYYINNEQAKAAQDNAPIDAIYPRSGHGGGEVTGEWATFSGLGPALQAKIQEIVDWNDEALGGKK